MKYTSWTIATVAALGVSVVACSDFLTGGELSTDPNAPTQATNRQLFVGVQSNIYYMWSGDLDRIASIFSQHLNGVAAQYLAIDEYDITEATANGQQRQLYGPGGLVDVRKLEAGTAARHDTLFLAIAQIQEAMLMGTNAEIFGDIVYSHALTGEANPPLDPQVTAFDSVQALLSRAIANLTTMDSTNRANGGPGVADLTYQGSPGKWLALAHTLKARFYMHTAELRGTAAYDSALVEAQRGITDSTKDYRGVFSGAVGEQNPWHQFLVSGHPGYLVPGAQFDALLASRSDPRRTNYFKVQNGAATGVSTTRLASTYPQPFVTAAENLLIWAEAAYRTGNEVTALQKLNAERTLYGIAPELVAGNALLTEILTEKYIVDFQLGVEGWQDYRRTCFPNLPNRSLSGQTPMPGRLYYDKDERLTNTSIPVPGVPPNGIRNQVDLPNATADAVGGACLAGA